MSLLNMLGGMAAGLITDRAAKYSNPMIENLFSQDPAPIEDRSTQAIPAQMQDVPTLGVVPEASMPPVSGYDLPPMPSGDMEINLPDFFAPEDDIGILAAQYDLNPGYVESALAEGMTIPDLREAAQLSDALYDGQKRLAILKLKKAQGEDTSEDESMLSKIGGGLKNFFGSEKGMLSMALAFNTLRNKPDNQLAAGIQDRLKTISATSKDRDTALSLLDSKDPRQQTVGQMMLSGMSQSDAIALTKESDFDKKWRLSGGDPDAYKKIFGGKGTTVNVGGEGSKGLEAVDKKFADDWVAWSQGGAASMQKNIGTLRTVIDSIKEGKNLSGTLIGLAPEQGLNLFAPEAKAARDRVAGVVQQSLKETLGAQFARSEAEQLIERAYDPALDEAENLARLEALALMIEATAKAKQASMAHFSKDFTMLGFEPIPIPTAQDFYDAMDQAAARITPFRQRADETKETPLPPNATPEIKKLWEHMTPEEREEVARELGRA